MSWQAVRDEVQTLLAGVSGIGQVHNRLRRIVNDQDLKAVLVSGGIINGWMHTRIGTQSTVLTNAENLERHQWMLRGWYSFDDAGNSEQTFQTLIEAIRAALRPELTLNDTAELVEPAQLLDNPEPHVLIPPGDGGVLCHMAELRFVIQERIAR